MKLGPVLVAIVWACASPACAPGPHDAAEQLGSSTGAITHGNVDPGDEAAVGVVNASGALACSGVLVASHVVLTAAHCTVPDVASHGSVVFGPSLAATSASIPIARAIAHPHFDPSTFANDVGILVLGATATVSPLPLGSSVPHIGDSLQVVGWGLTAGDAGDSGTRRKGTSIVTAVDATTFAVGPNPSEPCEGDSGGPALASIQGTSSVVGVTSHGDSACASGATYVRVDAFLASFIEPTLASFAVGSAGPGVRCLFPEQCAGGAAACIAATDDPSITYCTEPCSGSGDCPSGMACEEMQCHYPVPTPGANGSLCSSAADCLEGQCTTVGLCAMRCVPGGPSCPSGFSCVQTGDIDFYCLLDQSPTPSGARSGCSLSSRATDGETPWFLGGLFAVALVASRRAPRACSSRRRRE